MTENFDLRKDCKFYETRKSTRRREERCRALTEFLCKKKECPFFKPAKEEAAEE